MRLKIVHQKQENLDREELVLQKESVDTGDQMEETQMNPGQEDESMKENSTVLEVSPITAACPVLVSGKRKRKPKEQLINEFSQLISSKKMKKKKQHFPRSKFQRTPDGGGTLTRSVLFKSPTMIRAEEVQLSLGNDLPCFSKVLVRSHVGSCFWMGLPVPFCKLHLPAEDATVNLENETGEEFGMKYIAHKTGLSAGWRKFVAGNKLLEGDVLIFQLIGPCRFKVYIIRANDLTEVDGALSLLTLESQTKQSDAEGKLDAQGKKKRRPKSLPLVVFQKSQKEGSSVPPLGQLEEHSGVDSDEVASEVLEDSKFSGFALRFKDVKSFEEFHIMINGVCIDLELPENIRRKYYELCCSKNMFLHDHLLPGLSSKLAAGMIFEAVNTADAIRCCKLTTPKKEFEVWEKSLKSFELLGLKVGFFRARLCRLQSLCFDSEDAFEAKRYLDVKTERSRVEVEIRNLKEKLVELEELSAKYHGEIENLKNKAEGYDMNFQDEANAKW